MAQSAANLGRTVLFAGLLAYAAPAWPAQVAGVTLPPTESVQGAQLQLAGCAAREELWTDLYAVSLYLPAGATGAARMIDDQTPKLVRLDVTYNGEVPDGLPSEWKERLQQRVSQEFIQTLQNQYNKLRGGDTVRISYAPGSGTILSVNGNTIVTQPASELMNAMMQVWIGPNPVSDNIKRHLLRGSC